MLDKSLLNSLLLLYLEQTKHIILERKLKQF